MSTGGGAFGSFFGGGGNNSSRGGGGAAAGKGKEGVKLIPVRYIMEKVSQAPLGCRVTLVFDSAFMHLPLSTPKRLV